MLRGLKYMDCVSTPNIPKILSFTSNGIELSEMKVT